MYIKMITVRKMKYLLTAPLTVILPTVIKKQTS
jgi:hypothetical protein